MNADDIVVELGLVSEKTLGFLGPMCEWYFYYLEPADIGDPDWFLC